MIFETENLKHISASLSSTETIGINFNVFPKKQEKHFHIFMTAAINEFGSTDLTSALNF